MATNLSSIVSFNLGGIVSGAIDGVKTVRIAAQAEKETAFQNAVAEGSLSYADQVKYRQKQVEEEGSSTISDPEYLATLKTSLASLKKLQRYDDYRTKYNATYASVKEGRMSAQAFYDQINSALAGETDPTLKAEMQGELTSAAADVKTYNNTILQNQITRATTDKSPQLLDDAIKAVKSRRTTALLNKNDAEVSQYDAMLSTLTQQKNQVQVADDMNDIDIAVTTKGMNAVQKINTLTSKISSSDSGTPVIIDGVKYPSTQAYWQNTLSGYVSGSGSGIFKDASTDLSSAYTDVMNAQIAQHGYVPTPTLTAISNDFTTLKNNPALSGFVDKIGAIQNSVMYSAVDTTAKAIIANAAFTHSYVSAGQALDALQTTSGINLDTYRASLGNKFQSDTQQAINAGSLTAAGADALQKKAGLSPEQNPTPVTAPGAVPDAHGILVNPAPVTAPMPGVTTTAPNSTPAPMPGELTKDQAMTNLSKSGLTGGALKAAQDALTNHYATTAPVQTQSAPVVETTHVTPTPTATPVQTPTPTAAPIASVATPPSAVHMVSAGDTLSAIALKNGTTVANLAAINGIKDPNKLNVGQQIKLK